MHCSTKPQPPFQDRFSSVREAARLAMRAQRREIETRNLDREIVADDGGGGFARAFSASGETVAEAQRVLALVEARAGKLRGYIDRVKATAGRAPIEAAEMAAEMESQLAELKAHLADARARHAKNVVRRREIEARYVVLILRARHRPGALRRRPTVHRSRVQRCSRRARTVARVAAKTTSTGDPDPEPYSSARASSSVGAS